MHAPQAGLFAAALTPFIIDSKQSLKVDPSDQIVYYLEQHSTILSQISQQISSIAPQVPIPSTPPPPFPPVVLASSDVSVNAFWFVALVLSLSGALVATLVQQWARKCLNALRRYSDPIRSSRAQLYLSEQYAQWNIPVMAELAPSLLHSSLFLFFIGLAYYVLNLNGTVAICTIFFISICGLYYLFFTLAPLRYPQTLFRSPISDLLPSLYYKIKILGLMICGMICPGPWVWRNFSSNIHRLREAAQEIMKAQQRRDESAIRWLIDNLTQETEMESFVLAIPGSFNTDWGTNIWKNVVRMYDSEIRSTAGRSTLALTPVPHPSNIHSLSTATFPKICEWA